MRPKGNTSTQVNALKRTPYSTGTKRQRRLWPVTLKYIENKNNPEQGLQTASVHTEKCFTVMTYLSGVPQSPKTDI